MWNGPYRIEGKINEFTYKIDMSSTKAKFFPLIHISRMKPYISRGSRPTEDLSVEGIDFDEALLPEDIWSSYDGDTDYEVEKILDDKYTRPTRSGRLKKYYLLKWKGYEEPTWENEEDLDCGFLLYEYNKEKLKQRRAEAVLTREEEDEA